LGPGEIFSLAPVILPALAWEFLTLMEFSSTPDARIGRWIRAQGGEIGVR
jgi:hypothetical protein